MLPGAVWSFSPCCSHIPWTSHRLDRPFAQFSGRRFTGFTLTLLTLTATPTNGHAPCFLQPPGDHALFTRSLASHWLPLRTHSILIGRVLPPATACCEFCFSFFFLLPMFYTHSWEKRQPVREKSDLNPTPVQAAALATAVSLFCTGSDNTKVTFWQFIPQCQRENLQKWTQTG